MIFVSGSTAEISREVRHSVVEHLFLSVPEMRFQADPGNNFKMRKRTTAIQLLWILFLACTLSAWGQTPLVITTQADSLLCHSDDNGELFWEINGGEGPYNYEWRRLNNAFVFSGGTQMDPGPGGPVGGTLEANTYVLTVEDNSGALVRDTIEIGEPERILVLGISLSDAICAESCDGLINMTVGGGTGQLTTSWNDSSFQGPIREGLCQGEYVFFITDERGCRQKGSVPISAPPSIEVEFTSVLPTCSGAANGSISAEASGGVGGFEYQWSTGSSGSQVTDVASNSYVLTVIDEGGCEKDFSTLLPDGPPLDANVQVNYGCGDGNLIVSTQPINGSGPYEYEWSTGSSLPLLFQMSSGQYSLSLTDADGCTDQVDFVLDFVPPLTVEAQVQDVSCPGASDGNIVLNVSGGLPPYELLWDDQNDMMLRSDLSGGDYGYNINASGCGFAGNVQVQEPPAFQVSFNFVPQTDNFLMATALVSGGTFPYQYQWSNGGSGITANNLVEGQLYTVLITDANGCQQQWEFTPTLTDVDQFETKDQLSVFPNPSDGYFWIDHPEGGTYRLYDLQGRLLRTGEFFPGQARRIDISDAPSAAYQLQFFSPSSSSSTLLVKE